MDNINYILKDESNNDEQLIKELSICVKNHKNKRLPINKEFIKDIIDITLKNSEIDFNGIYFINDDDFIAFWYSKYREIYFNTTSMINNARDLKDVYFKSKNGNYKIFLYFDIISTVIHELTHARQNFLMDNGGNDIYASCNNLIDEMYDVYLMNHDKVLTERYANLRGNTIAYQVLSYVYSSKEINELRYLIYDYLTEGYGINYSVEDVDPETNTVILSTDSTLTCPIDEYNDILESVSQEKVNIEANDDMSLYDRMYLGLPISTEEFLKLSTILRDIINKERQEEDVKKLVYKL